MSNLPPSFQCKKRKILEQLAVPETEYDDLSPKGSVDTGIRDLIDEINGRDGLVTTSSCGGRVSVFLEGVKSSGLEETRMQTDDRGEDGIEKTTVKLAGVGGKGGGGRWLFVSHDSVDIDSVGDSFATHLGMQRTSDLDGSAGIMDVSRRWIHFKFEPMILHILTASPEHAQPVLTAAHQAGFRESGALSLTPTSLSEPPTPMVAVRTMGLALESIIGSSSKVPDDSPICIVPEEYLRMLIETANVRFIENTKRIEKFRNFLSELFDNFGRNTAKLKADGSVWEDAAMRRERLRADGLKRAEEIKAQKRGIADVGEEQSDE